MNNIYLLMFSILRISHQLSIVYPEFSYTIPNFAADEDMRSFFNNEENLRTVGVVAEQERRGQVELFDDGYMDARFGCSWRHSTEAYRMTSIFPVTDHVVYALPLLGNDYDGSIESTILDVLPKIAQAYDGAEHSYRYLPVTMPARTMEVHDVLVKMTGRAALAYPGGQLSADHVLMTCRAPEMHPQLWDSVRRTMGVLDETPSTVTDHRYVILVLNTHVNLRGRTILNRAQLVAALEKKYGDRFKICKENHNLTETMALFSQAYAILGVTGPMLTSVLYAPRRCRLVEICPTIALTGSTVPAYDRPRMLWKLTQSLRMSYWRLPHTPMNNEGTVVVDIERVLTALEG